MSDGLRWQYRAANAAGHEVTGELTASTEEDALGQLRRASLWVIRLEPQRAASTLPQERQSAQAHGLAESGRSTGASAADGHDSRTSIRSLGWPPTWWTRLSGQQTESLTVLVRGIATLLAAGVPIDKALRHAATTAQEPWRVPFTRVHRAVREGHSLSAACSAEAAFPVLFGPSLAAAEATGTLAAAFESLADHLERGADLQRRIRAALTYPALLAISSALATLVIVFVVVPRFSVLLTDSGADLPFSTRMLASVSEGLRRSWWLWFAGIGSSFLLFRQSLHRPENRRQWHARRLKFPVWGRAEWHLDSARYLRTLSLALTAGVSVLRAMALARGAVVNTALAERLGQAEVRVRDGQRLGEAMGELLPPLPRQLLEAGEAAGALGPLAERAARVAETAAQHTIARVVALIEPLLILGLGGLVGFVALALLQAIYGLNAGGF